MGEAKRRKALEYGITQQNLPPSISPTNSRRRFSKISPTFWTAQSSPAAGDDLLIWPFNSIIGHTTEITKVRECPFIKEIREKTPFQGSIGNSTVMTPSWLEPIQSTP